jgi:uncharacterized protein YpiB (UPF0302 family)
MYFVCYASNFLPTIASIDTLNPKLQFLFFIWNCMHYIYIFLSFHSHLQTPNYNQIFEKFDEKLCKT